MGLQTLIIGFAVLAVAVIILMPMFGDSFADAQDKLDDLQKANSAGNNPTIGDTVCDLKIHIYGEIDTASQDGRTAWFVGITDTHIFINDKIDQQPPIQTSWINCHTVGGNSLVSLFGGMSLFDMAINQPPKELDVSVIGVGETFTIKIEGTNTNGDLLVDSIKRIEWSKTIQVPNDSFTLPYAFDHLFVLDNVVAENYTLKITAIGKQLNNEGSNQFITEKVFAP